MAVVTRLGLHGAPAAPFGSFAGKVELVAIVPPITGGVAAPVALTSGGIAAPVAVFDGGVAAPSPLTTGGVAAPEPV